MSRASENAYRFIRAEILSGSLAPGEQLREEQLADACGVSRTPVREALRRLEAERFIQRNDSKRTFVTDWSFDEIEESFALRGILEGRAAVRAATRISCAEIDRLEGHNNAIRRALDGKTPDIPMFLDHNRAFHGIILEAAASQNLAQLLSRIVEQPIVARTARQYDKAQLARSLAEHDELVLAFRRHDPVWAEAVMTAHIRRAFHAYSDARGANVRLEAAE
ncbi:MAG: GntR family transcriptional regulator [Sphingomonas sp.]|nr:GntR family transcriptional regulator [Sphingomonas sp.]